MSSKPTDKEELAKLRLAVDRLLLSAESATSASLEGAEQILDTERALAMMGGNVPLLERTLDRFIERYADSDQTLRNQLRENQTDELRHFARTLKGVAGTIAADALQQTAARIEAATRQASVEPEDVADLVDIYATQLAMLLQAVTLFRGTQ